MTKYKWRFQEDNTRDLKVYEIQKDDGKKPFTVVLRRYSEGGDKQLFSDLFWSDDWDEKRGNDGTVSDDVKFCISLWKKLGLEAQYGSFHPKHIEHDLDRFPIVYRNTLENVMSLQFGKGCGHSIEVEDGWTDVKQDPNPTVIPLVFNCNESEEQVQKTIFNAIQKSL